MVMECNYGGGLFLEFQPLTDSMLCEGVGHPYCRLYYLWKTIFNMAAKEICNECQSHISVNSTGNSDTTYCKNCMEYEIQLKEALDELTSTQMINKLLLKELLSLNNYFEHVGGMI